MIHLPPAVEVDTEWRATVLALPKHVRRSKMESTSKGRDWWPKLLRPLEDREAAKYARNKTSGALELRK